MRAANTEIAYARGWSRWERYCAERPIDPMRATPDDVLEYITHLMATARNPRATTAAGQPLSAGTIALSVQAIRARYTDAGLISPTQNVAQKIKRMINANRVPVRRVDALRKSDILLILERCSSNTLIGVRNAAMIALGYSAALRRSEICALDCEDLLPVTDDPGRAWLLIRRSKTDQAGAGQRIPIRDGADIRPIAKTRLWLGLAGITQGPMFRAMTRGGRVKDNPLHHSDIPRLLKHYAGQIGIDPSNIAGLSLRAGFITEAAASGARMDKIMDISRHRNPEVVMRYIRDANAWDDHAGSFL